MKTTIIITLISILLNLASCKQTNNTSNKLTSRNVSLKNVELFLKSRKFMDKELSQRDFLKLNKNETTYNCKCEDSLIKLKIYISDDYKIINHRKYYSFAISRESESYSYFNLLSYRDDTVYYRPDGYLKYTLELLKSMKKNTQSIEDKIKQIKETPLFIFDSLPASYLVESSTFGGEVSSKGVVKIFKESPIYEFHFFGKNLLSHTSYFKKAYVSNFYGIICFIYYDGFQSYDCWIE